MLPLLSDAIIGGGIDLIAHPARVPTFKIAQRMFTLAGVARILGVLEYLHSRSEMMDELLKMLTDRLGLDQGAAVGVAGKAMGMIKEQVDSSTFSNLASAIPGVESAIASAESGEASGGGGGGGLLGSLAGALGGLLGGSAGKSLELGAALTKQGLPADKIGEFATMLVSFIKDKAGASVLEQIYGQFPMLKSLIGDD